MARDWMYLSRALPISTLLLVVALQQVYAKTNLAQMSVLEIEDAIQQCPLVKDLNRHRQAANPPTSGLTAEIFAILFPGSPAVNALLATLYISDFLLALCPPNIDPSSLSVMVAFAVGGLLGDTIFHLLPEIFLGEALPENARFVLVEPNKNILLGVAILVGFVTFVAMDKGLRIATGGEGDHNHSHNDDHKVEATASEKEEEDDVSTSGTTTGADSSLIYDNLLSRKTKPTAKATEVPLDPPSNLEKILALDEPDRTNEWLQAVLEASPSSALTQMTLWRAYESQLEASTSSTLLAPPAFIKKITTLFPTAKAVTVNVRTPQGSESEYLVDGIGPRSRSPAISPRPSPSASASPSIRLSAYLNLLADFTHNITDGLALSASFYASPTLGATTTVAVFFHEIPHEVGDFALLIQSGFSKRRAMAAQFVTALGAFLGTFLGIAVQELGKTTAAAKGVHGDAGGTVGFFGTGLGWGDLLLPFTAGTFLYVGTVAVIPDLLETGPDRGLELTKTIKQFAALTVGAGIMLAISWS